MAIYKLKDLYSKKPQYGASLAAQETGEYRYVRQADISTKVFNTFVDSGPLLYEGDILISRVGAYAGKTYIHDSRKNHVFAGFLVRYKFDEKKLMNKYFYYWTKTNIYIDQMMKLRTGVAQPNFNPGSVGELKIDLPSIEQQKKIIDIIEPYKELFFKYGNLFELDSILNVKKGIKTLIDIIEPLEKLRNKVMSLNVYINNSIELYISKNIETTSLCDISDIKKYSKLINSEDLSPNNDFYYSTGKTFSENKKTNISNFENGLSIPYEGAGMLCKNDNYFVTYHPEKVYIGRKYGIKSKFPMTIYYSIHNRINGELSKNIGLKMPKLTREMLDNMQIISPDKDVEKNFLMFHNLKSKLDNIRDRVDKNISEILLLNII